jgi:hypothetical protein
VFASLKQIVVCLCVQLSFRAQIPPDTKAARGGAAILSLESQVSSPLDFLIN